MTRVKICGIRSAEEARQAAAAGADYLGLVFAPSRRRIDLELARQIDRALPGGPPRVGVFVDATATELVAAVSAGGLSYLQLHGDRAEAELTAMAMAAERPYIRALRAGRDDPGAAAPSAFALLLDSYVEGVDGGTGRAFDWRLAVGITRQRRLFLAGGLTPANVGSAIDTVRPFAVDVSSGVEKASGGKDPELVRAFIAAVRAADRALARTGE
jgi:phosphoribosylanthranilate isomerase